MFRHRLFFALSILFSLQSISSAQNVVYREIFPTDSILGTLDIGSANWVGNRGALGVQIGVGGVVIPPLNGSPTNAQPVNSSPTNSGIALGYVLDGNSAQNAPINRIIWTNEFAIPLINQGGSTWSWHQGNSNTALAAENVRLAIQIGGSWFATSQVFTNPDVLLDTDFSANAATETFAFTRTAAAWRDLTFVPGTSLALGAVRGSDIPQGDITAFGLYSDVPLASVSRFDTFEVSAIPEPTTVALFGVSIAVGVAFIVRRRLRTKREENVHLEEPELDLEA